MKVINRRYELTTISFFSAGVSSAVATKLAIDQIDRIIYTHIDDQHPDTMRFVRDCEEWFGKPVEILQHDLKTVEAACLSAGGRGYINGPGGAACTKLLKRGVRLNWEKAHDKEPLRYVWGIDLTERHRCIRLEETMPMQEHMFPLVDAGMSKTDAHKVLTASVSPVPTTNGEEKKHASRRRCSCGTEPSRNERERADAGGTA